MPLLSWSDKFSINVESIDTQHRRLFELANEMYDMANTNSEKQALVRALNDLLDYTVYHFQSEERLMQEQNYPRYAAHRQVHEALTRQALDFKAKVDNGESVSARDFLKFLFDWLAKHIMDQDKKIGTYIDMNKIKPLKK